MYVMNMINILYYEILIMKLRWTLHQQVVRVFGDGCEDSMEENSPYGPVGVLWDCSRWSVVDSSGGGGVGMADGGSGDRLCIWVEMRK